MTNKVTFDKNYQTLFQQILNKLNKNSPSPSLSPLGPSSNSLPHNKNKTQKHKKINLSDHLRERSFHQQIKSIQNGMKPIRQTTYFAFGQCSPAKSLQLRKTFVNLGNSRYQINKSPQPEFNKTQTYFLRSMDFQKSTYNVNNLAFPIINEKSKQPKSLTTTLPLHQESPKISNRLRSLSKRKNNRKSNSLQLSVQIKSFNSKSVPKKSPENSSIPEIATNNPEVQKSPFKSISQLSKSVDIQASQFLKQMVFAKQYERKLYQIENNIILKRRFQRMKQKNSKKQYTQKEPIDPWKHQNRNLNSPEGIQEMFDGFNKKQLFF